MNNFDVTFRDLDGTPAVQAGSHPFATTTSLGMNLNGEEPDGRLRELFLDLPPGLVASTTSIPRCSEADFEALDEGVNDCPDVTAIGVASMAVGEADNWTIAPIFNLVAPPGVLMRLGFRVADAANVVVDLELSPEPPYRLLASTSEIPEAVKLFAAKLQLWGVPASPSHDELRGICGVTAAADSCPVAVEERSFLTLPTSCEGPQATFYEALSWDGDEDFGDALTHDGAENPLGFVGCKKLAFDPLSSVHLATEEAQSPTGLDISFSFADPGLSNPDGIAESQIRDLALALPEGVSAPSLTHASGGCSEADVEAETPESAPGAGCPAGSELGTAEVESPLVEGQLIHGSIYRATPNENFAGSPMALYLVLKDAVLGVVMVQPVALGTDPATGQLLAVAEEMPQLPFSRLRLNLDDGKGGPLVSPPLCGKYETEAEFERWAGGGAFRTLSTFQISSGPNGGPCPSGVHASQGAPSGGSPPAASAPVVLPPPVLHRRRCGKRKHFVRRHGKTHCVRTHRKHKPHGR